MKMEKHGVGADYSTNNFSQMESLLSMLQILALALRFSLTSSHQETK